MEQHITPLKPNLSGFFDKVILINLKRRPDRLKYALGELERINWPFNPPELIEGVDGQLQNLPIGFVGGHGAYGCNLSHVKALELAIKDGTENLLILEDDIVFESNFLEGVNHFLSNLPINWDIMMFGGNHFIPPEIISDGICRCKSTGLTHAYAIRRPIMEKMLQKWRDALTYTDIIFAQEQAHYKVYGPDPFIVSQNKLLPSDISMARKRRGETNREHQKRFEPYTG